MPRHGAFFRGLFRVLCCAVLCQFVSYRVLSRFVMLCWALIGQSMRCYLMPCSFAGGDDPKIPHRGEKSYPPFSLFLGAMIQCDRPIRAQSLSGIGLSAQSLSGIGLSMFHRGGPISSGPMSPAWGATLIGRSHLIVSHGFGDKLFSRGRDFW